MGNETAWVSGNDLWVMLVNLVIWTGIFLYLLRLDRMVRSQEDEE